MASAAHILLPIFALIAAGFVARRLGWFGPAAAAELNRFVVHLAFPALLFSAMARTSWRDLDQPALATTFALSCAAVFAAVLAWRMISGRRLADASIDAIAASYPNAGFIGFPLCLLAFGPASLTAATIVNILVATVLFGVTCVLMEFGLQEEPSRLKMVLKVFKGLARNPMIVAPLAGALVSGLKLKVPGAAGSFLSLLGGAATPAALVGLGMFLAEKRSPARGTTRDSVLLMLAKLLMQPLVAWWLAFRVFALPASLGQIVVMLAALPTGTGPYMLAEHYKRDASLTSRIILLSTAVSLVSLSVLMTYLHAAH
ncbi:AEC family transporter [Paraburkholderia sp. EG287B]|uniref:AEC family transporter n=1 Tax=unclassified Paraburkholderia TaxID=2615204 RepID=UPI0034D216BA